MIKKAVIAAATALFLLATVGGTAATDTIGHAAIAKRPPNG